MRSPLEVRVHSHLPLRDQVKAIGPTRLDRIPVGLSEQRLTGKGRVAAAEAVALQQRRMFLIEQGVMGASDEKLGGHAMVSMAKAELAEAARRVSLQLGVPVLTQHRGSVEGAYVQRVDLGQGRMAIILQERQAFIVPWRPTLSALLAAKRRGAMRGNGLSWSLGIKRSQSLPPM